MSACLLAAGIPLDSTTDGPQVIKLEPFRKALWKVHISVNGTPGDFLFDTGGGNTRVSEAFSSRLGCTFWGRNTGYNMFGERGDGPHGDDVHLTVSEVSLTPVDVRSSGFISTSHLSSPSIARCSSRT